MTQLCKMFCPDDLQSAVSSNGAQDDKGIEKAENVERAIDQ